jgi:hypothetical protein
MSLVPSMLCGMTTIGLSFLLIYADFRKKISRVLVGAPLGAPYFSRAFLQALFFLT